MSAKKRWISKNCDDLCTEPSTSNDLDISWSSSSSEIECTTPRKSNSQADQHKPLNQWIRTALPKKIQYENVYNQPTTSTNHSFEASPIIGRSRFDLSPVTDRNQIKYKPKRLATDFGGEQSSCFTENDCITPKKFKSNTGKHINLICDQHSTSIIDSFEESPIIDRYQLDLSPVIGRNPKNHKTKRILKDVDLDQSSSSFENDRITPMKLKSNASKHFSLVCEQASTSINHNFEEFPITNSLDLSPVIGKHINQKPKRAVKDFNLEHCTPKKAESNVQEQPKPVYDQPSILIIQTSPIIDKSPLDLSPVIGTNQINHKPKRLIKDFDIEQTSSTCYKDCTTLEKCKRNADKHIEPFFVQSSVSRITSFEKSPIIGRFGYDLSPFSGKNHINCKAKRIDRGKVEEQQLNMIIENCSPDIKKISRYKSQALLIQQPISTCSIQQPKNIGMERNLSPIIGKTQIDFKTKMIIDSDFEECNSRSRYSTQQSNTIENDSPTQKTQMDILSQQSFYQPTQYSIHPVSSQNSSEVILSTESITTDSPKRSKTTLITESTETSSSKSSGCEPLYHEVSPRRKKRYKKDGLADQLQKARQQQKIDFAIWRHELYLKKSNSCWFPDTGIENSVLLLKITKFWEEFGLIVVECEPTDEQNSTNSKTLVENIDSVIKKNNTSESNVNLNKCLVIIGFNVTHDVRIKINAKFKLCMPYITKIVKYNELPTFCHVNVSKLLSFK